ncbi:exonuclease 1, partial [Fagus crenata]
MSPNHPSPEDNSSLSPKEYITVDAAEYKTNCLPASLLESENMGTVPLANNPVEDDLASEVTEFSGKAIISLKIYKFNEEFIL